jgi:hypothetical protein
MATRQPVGIQIALLSQKMDNLTDVTNEIRQNQKDGNKRTDDIVELLARHDERIEHTLKDVGLLKTSNVLAVVLSASLSGLIVGFERIQDFIAMIFKSK